MIGSLDSGQGLGPEIRHILMIDFTSVNKRLKSAVLIAVVMTENKRAKRRSWRLWTKLKDSPSKADHRAHRNFPELCFLALHPMANHNFQVSVPQHQIHHSQAIL
jgi:hypothetical protein